MDGMKVAGFAFAIKGMPTHSSEPGDARERRAKMIGSMYHRPYCGGVAFAWIEQSAEPGALPRCEL